MRLRKAPPFFKASAGPLEPESTWHEWEPSFENYLHQHMVWMEFPSHVIRPNDLQDYTTTFFFMILMNERAIANASLAGATFDSDKKCVYQLMVLFMQG